MTTVTTTCPASLWTAYVQLRRCIAPTEADADSPPNGTPGWQRDGTEHVVSSMPRQPWVLAALEPLTEPEWGADMALAQQAQAALVVWPEPEAEEPGDPPQATPDKITVIVGLTGRDAVSALGLERIITDED